MEFKPILYVVCMVVLAGVNDPIAADVLYYKQTLLADQGRLTKYEKQSGGDVGDNFFKRTDRCGLSLSTARNK